MDWSAFENMTWSEQEEYAHRKQRELQAIQYAKLDEFLRTHTRFVMPEMFTTDDKEFLKACGIVA